MSIEKSNLLIHDMKPHSPESSIQYKSPTLECKPHGDPRNATQPTVLSRLRLLLLTTGKSPRKWIQTQFLSGDRLIRRLALSRRSKTSLLTGLPSATQNPCNETSRTQTVVVRRDGIGHPRRISIGINDTNSRHIIQPTLMQHDHVLERVQTNHQIRLDRRAIRQIPLELLQLLIHGIDHFRLAVAQNLLPVRQCTRDPPLKDVVPLGQLGSSHNSPLLALPCTCEQDDPAPSSDLFDNLCCTTEVGGRHVEGYDVHAFTDTEDVAGVLWVPARC